MNIQRLQPTSEPSEPDGVFPKAEVSELEDSMKPAEGFEGDPLRRGGSCADAARGNARGGS